MSYVNITGDVGGVGISRFHWRTASSGTPTGSDCNSAAAAVYDLWFSARNQLPDNIVIEPGTVVQTFDVASGAVTNNIAVTTPGANVTGVDANSYGAGLGCRINYQTTTVHGRRFIRGATFFVPMGQNSYTTDGNINSGALASINTAVATMINAFIAAGLTMVVYGRPPKGSTTGGHMGDITAWTTPATPAGLRSRRT